MNVGRRVGPRQAAEGPRRWPFFSWPRAVPSWLPPATLFAVSWPASDRVAMAPFDAVRAAFTIRASGAEEAVVLATAERIDCYVVARGERAAIDAVVDGLAGALGTAAAGPGSSPRVRCGADAARHVVRVACGLESTVPVLEELRRAYHAAQTARSVGVQLHRVLQGALTTATRCTAAHDVERCIEQELARLDDWRLRREAFATVVA